MTSRRSFVKGVMGASALLSLGGCRFWCGGKGNKFALNASTLRGYGLNLTDQLKAAAAGGFGGFEPWLKDLHAAKAAGILGDAVAFARDSGIEFINGIAFGQWASPDKATRLAGLEETKRDMALLAEIGCRRIAASMFGVQQVGAPLVSTNEIAERYAAVCELGERMGIEPLLEYWGHSANMSTPEQAMAVLRQMGEEERPILADVYHTYRGGSDFAIFKKFTEKTLPVLHVNDYPSGKPRTELVDADRVWPGCGAAPWEQIFANLQEGGADPWLSIEVFNPNYWLATPAATAREGMEHLKRVQKRRKLQLGVQMWSVNEIWKQSPALAFRRLKKMGYNGVQSFGFLGMDWNELEKMLRDEGLAIIDMPFYLKTLKGDGEKRFVEFCQRFNIDFVFEPHWGSESPTEWRKHAQELKAIAARFAEKGLRTGYHNHQHEFKPMADGTRAIDILYDAGLDFELDVGHAKLAKDDPIAWLNKLGGRVPSIHAKPAGGNSVGGKGDRNDWQGIMRAASAAGAKWAIVECETRRNTYEDVEESMEFLKNLEV